MKNEELKTKLKKLEFKHKISRRNELKSKHKITS